MIVSQGEIAHHFRTLFEFADILGIDVRAASGSPAARGGCDLAAAQRGLRDGSLCCVAVAYRVGNALWRDTLWSTTSGICIVRIRHAQPSRTPRRSRSKKLARN